MIKELRVFAIVVLVIFGFLAIYTYIGHKNAPNKFKRKAKQNKEYFDNFNEYFQGVITDIKVPEKTLRGGYKQCLLKVKLDFSTIKHYDPRDSLKFYYCLIDYPFAEIVEEYSLGLISIGDSLVFDGIKDTCYIKLNSWGAFKPDIRDNNIQLLKPFWSVPKYSKKELQERMKSYPKPFDLPNDYYMLLFMKTKDKKGLHQYYKKMEEKVEHSDYFEGLTLYYKYFERRGSFYYFFYSDRRYGQYKDAVKAWKKAGFNELYIVKFDKHNKFIKIMEKTKKKN